jgi:hypothetical protein
MSSPEEILLARSFVDTVEMIQPKKGSYQITQIGVANDYVAIAPIAVRKESNIIVPDEESVIGIIVGMGPLVPEEMKTVFAIGTTVRFSPKPVICNLDRLYAFYGKARILLVKYHNLLAAVDGESVYVIGVDKAKE